MNLDQYEGRQIDLDGFPSEQPYQCYDFANQYSLDLGYQKFTGLYASDIFGQQPDNYDWVANTPEGVPPRGAVVVWDHSFGNGAGHVDVATGSGDTNGFETLDQNWDAPRVTRVYHNSYNGVIGWGIPKNQNNQGDEIMTPDEETLAYNIVLGRQPEAGANLGHRTAFQFIRDAEGELSDDRKQARDDAAKVAQLSEQVAQLQAQLSQAPQPPQQPQAPVETPPTQVPSPSSKPTAKSLWQQIVDFFRGA